MEFRDFDNGIRPNRVAGQAVKGFSGKFNPFNFKNTNSIGAGSGACTTGYWNCNAFADPNPKPDLNVQYQFGDMPRNSAEIRGFGFYDETSGSTRHSNPRTHFRRFPRGDVQRLQPALFNKPDSGIQDTNFGQIGSTLLGPRNVQFMLRLTY